MKKPLFIGCFIVLLICSLMVAGNFDIYSVQASTEVAGIIASNTTWTQANSPYELTGNILISQNVTLTIESGVTVNLNDYDITVNGTLNARGNNFMMDPIYINGGKITFTEFSADWNESSNTGCILENTILSSAMTVNNSLKMNSVFNDGFIGVQKPGKPIISNNTLRGGISIYGDGIISNNTILDQGIMVWENATITGNTISYCSTGIEAVTYFWDDNNPTAWPNCTSLIERNLIVRNTNGIVVREQQGAHPGRPIIQNNTIIDNSVGIYVTWIGLGGPSPIILNNNINYNSDFNFKTNVPNDINATYNWWGTTNTSTIDLLIYDFYEDFNLRKVTYLPSLSQSNPNAAVIPSSSPQLSLLQIALDSQVYKITFMSNSTIFVWGFNQTLKELKFDAEGISGTTGFCNVSIPADLMSGTFSIYKDNALLVQDVDYTETYNGTHYMFDIFYSHSVHTIRIVSSQVVPDLPANFMLILVIMALSTGAILLRKKLLKNQKNEKLV